MLKSNWIVGLLGASALFAGGCQFVRNSPPEKPSDSPLLIDSAMQLRDWTPSSSVYASGDTVAKPTGFPLEVRWYRPEWHYAIGETPLFIGEVLFLPVMAFITPPWRETRYTGDTVEPSYSAQPAIPASGQIPEPLPYTAW